jgi:peroxiredoxin
VSPEKDYLSLPDGLPVPEDDGAADHLVDTPVPALSMAAHDGTYVDLAQASRGLLVLFAYPRTGVPGEPLIEGWDDIPGARGCTPQNCAFRDLHAELAAAGARVLGLSAQTREEQAEFAERTGLQYRLLSDPGLDLAKALSLPTFEAGGLTLYKRLTFVAREGVVEKVFYPVFPPDRNAPEVLAWLTR